MDTGEDRMKMTIRRYAARVGAVALCTALCSAPILAQGGGGGMMRMSPDDRVAAIDKAVGLTDEQKPKVKAIIEADQKKMMDLRNSGGDMQTLRPKMMEIRTQENADIKALLTDDQKTKYDAYVASMPQGRGRGNGGGSGAPSTPPPTQQ
jgi:Spy/CpxP family protein refolding chaperone